MELDRRRTIGAEELSSAISSARRRLAADFCDARNEPKSSQVASRGDIGGYWCGELEADTTLESDYILFLYLFNREKYADKMQRLARCIDREQLDDGSWNVYHGGPGEISATVKAYVSLKLAGYDPESPKMIAAREAIDRLGGVHASNSYTKINLALLGLMPRSHVPALPPEVVLLPRFFYFNIYEISYWSRAILIPLSILYAKWPTEGACHVSIDEIFGAHSNGNGRSSNGVASDGAPSGAGRYGAEAPLNGSSANGVSAAGLNGNAALNGNGVLDGNGAVSIDGSNGVNSRDGQGPAKGLFSWKNFFLMANRVLQIVEKTPVKPLRGIALKKAEKWMLARLADSDGLGAIFPSMCNSVLAMLCLGYSSDHPLVKETLSRIEELEIERGDEIHLQPCLSPVWDTALAINAVDEAAYADEIDYGADSRDFKMLQEAGRWLVSKEVRRAGDWKIRVRDAECSGWPFQFRNDFYPDIDDTAAVVMALGRLDPNEVEGLEGAVTRAINWVIRLQCTSGGWAAFDADVEREILNEVPYADHNAMLDPACADITGRVLEMFGRFPSVKDHPRVRRSVAAGIRHLKDTQEEDGSWYGRWGVNYIYGTWQALKGLMAVGESASEPYIGRAVEFLKGVQNDDGGWGESCESYDEHAPAGRGPSTASQTAWAVMGLLAAGEIDSEEVQRGMRYLLDHQQEDGNWDDQYWTGTGFPGVFYLKYHMYQLYFPLFALGMYQNARDGRSSIEERFAIDLEQRFAPPEPINGHRLAEFPAREYVDTSFGQARFLDCRELESDPAEVPGAFRANGAVGQPRKKSSIRSLFGLLS